MNERTVRILTINTSNNKHT